MTSGLCLVVPEAMPLAAQLTACVFGGKMVKFTYFCNRSFTFFWPCAGVNLVQLSVQLHLENMLHIHILFHTHAGIFNAQLKIRYYQTSSQPRPGPGKKSVAAAVVWTLTKRTLPGCSYQTQSVMEEPEMWQLFTRAVWLWAVWQAGNKSSSNGELWSLGSWTMPAS